MSEPLRTERSNAGPLSDADREARIEQLLLSGLDQYFAGQYEQAINIWTRVAFLERGHGRARAYIERARSALAERQRESEELLHGGVAAYNAGDLDAARDLLTRSLEQGGPNDTALLFLQRVTRFETVSDASRTEAPRGAAVEHAPTPLPARSRWLVTATVSATLAAVILLGALPVASWLSDRPIAAPAIDAPAPEPLQVVRTSEVVIARARALHQDGRLLEALRLIERIDVADPHRAEADRLRAAVQRDLLAATVRNPAGPPSAIDIP